MTTIGVVTHQRVKHSTYLLFADDVKIFRATNSTANCCNLIPNVHTVDVLIMSRNETATKLRLLLLLGQQMFLLYLQIKAFFYHPYGHHQ